MRTPRNRRPRLVLLPPLLPITRTRVPLAALTSLLTSVVVAAHQRTKCQLQLQHQLAHTPQVLCSLLVGTQPLLVALAGLPLLVLLALA